MGELWVIDRFEGDFAVLEDEDGSHINAHRDLIPYNAHEGDVIEPCEHGFTVREDLTAQRRERIREKSKKLFRHRSDTE